MKIGLSTAAFYGKWEVEEAAALLGRYGAECAEVFLQTRSEYAREFARLVRKNLNGVPCTSVHPFGTAFENEFFARSTRQRADALDTFRHALDAAAELGAHLYVYHGRYSPARIELPFEPQRNAEILTLMQEEAARRDIRVAWENVCWCQLTTPKRVSEMRKLLPEIRFTLDIKQAMRAGAIRWTLWTRWGRSWPMCMCATGTKTDGCVCQAKARSIFIRLFGRFVG